MLELLAVAGAPLHEGELIAVSGAGAEGAMEALSEARMVRREGGRVWLVSPPASRGKSLAPDAIDLWEALGRVTERTLAGWPHDPAVLLVRCRVLTRNGNVPVALELIERSRPARLAADLSDLETSLRSMAAADPPSSQRALVILAREQLRRGEVEAARQTLEEAHFVAEGPPSDDLRLLRAEAHARAGKPGFALEDLKLASFSSRLGAAGVKVLMAGLQMLAGRLVEARRALLNMARETAGSPELEGRRWAALSLSYVFEERFALARAAARRARKAYGHPNTAPLEPLLWLIDFLARLRLDDIDAAAAMAAADHRVRPGDREAIPSLVRAALAGRQGDLQTCLRMAGECADRLDRRADRFLHAVILRYMAQAAVELGQLDRAEALVRELAGEVKEAGLAVLEPILELEFALLAYCRGDTEQAQRRSLRALELAPRNPYIRIEAWRLANRPVAIDRPTHPSLAAYYSARAADRALQAGALGDALNHARAASAWYHHVGARAEEARVLTACGEALARRGHYEEAGRTLDMAQELAQPLALAPVLVAGALIRASIADRTGHLDEYVRQLAMAARAANRTLMGRAMVLACSRAGFIAGASTSLASPFGPLVERLGLTRPATTIVTVGGRTFLADGRIEHGAELQLDLEMGLVSARGHAWDLSAQPLIARLLECLADAGDRGLSTEALYRLVWGAEYHALRHRNTLYGAINRVRRGLAGLIADRQIIAQSDGNYRLENVTVAVVRAARTSEAQLQRIARRATLLQGPMPDARDFAVQHGITLAHARWDMALAKEQGTDVEVASRRSWPGIP